MKFNVTQLRDYLKCPQFSYNLHVARRGIAYKSVTLEIGTLFHEAVELRMKSVPIALENFQDMPSWDTSSPEAIDTWYKHRLWLPISAFTPEPGWDVRGVETVLEAVLSPGVELQGRLDGIVAYNGKYWSLQWKTYEDDLMGLMEKVRLSWHESAYQWLAERNNLTPWGGTILGACQKLPGYRMQGSPRRRVDITDQQRVEALSIHYLFRAQSTQKRMEQDLKLQLTRLASSVQAPEIIGRNYDFCWGTSGRNRCPYYTVCHEGDSLENERYINIESRY